jgi:hypothetical protein
VVDDEPATANRRAGGREPDRLWAFSLPGELSARHGLRRGHGAVACGWRASGRLVAHRGCRSARWGTHRSRCGAQRRAVVARITAAADANTDENCQSQTGQTMSHAAHRNPPPLVPLRARVCSASPRRQIRVANLMKLVIRGNITCTGKRLCVASRPVASVPRWCPPAATRCPGDK